MDNSKLLLGTVAGGLTMFFGGYLLYGLLLMGFFEANAVTNVMIDPPRWLWLVLGNLGTGLFVTYVFLQWAGIKTAEAGFKGGATLGFLTGLAINLTWYGTTDLMTLTGHLVDIVVGTVLLGLVGAVVGLVLGRN